jgi:lysozyme
MSKDYEEAADEMLDSKWAEQVGTRAVRLADQMRRGSPPLVETRQV